MKFLIWFSIAVFLASCARQEDVAGGSTTVENGIVMAQISLGGHVQANTKVTLLAADFQPQSGAKMRIRISDANGWVQFDSLGSGDYNLVAQKDSLGAFVSQVHVNDRIQVNLLPTSTLRIHQANSAYLLGTPWSGVYHSQDSTVVFENLPAGYYPILVVNQSQKIDLQIAAQETLEIDAQNLNFQFSPIPLNSQLKGRALRSVGVDPLGRPWVVAEDQELWYMASQTWSLMPFPDVLSYSDQLLSIRLPKGLSSSQVGIPYLLISSQGPILEDELNALSLNLPGSTIKNSCINSQGFAALIADSTLWLRPSGQSWQNQKFTSLSSLLCREDRLYLGTSFGQVYVLSLSDLAPKIFAQVPSSVLSLSQMDNELYIASAKGVYHGTTGQVSLIPNSPDSLRQIVHDSLGILWALRGTSQVFKYSKTNWQHWQSKLIFREISAMGQGVIAACDTQGLYLVH